MHPLSRIAFKQSLFQDIDETEFFAEYWEKQPYVFRDKSNSRLTTLFGSLKPRERISIWFELIGSHPETKGSVWIPGRVQDNPQARRKHVVNLSDEAMRDAYEEGVDGNYMLFSPHCIDREVMQFRNRLLETVSMTEFKTPLVAAYIHQGPAQGADPHFDQSAVFQINLAGRRRWLVTDTPVDHWNPSAVYRNSAGVLEFQHSAEGHVVLDPEEMEWYEIILEPGDVLYLPASTPHQTSPVSDFSVGVSCFFEGIRPAELFSRSMQLWGSTDWNSPIPVPTSPMTGMGVSLSIEKLFSQYLKMVDEWREAMEHDSDVFHEVLDQALPENAQYCRLLQRQLANVPFSADATFEVPEERLWFVTRRADDGGIVELRSGVDCLEFQTPEDRRIAELLYSGGTFKCGRLREIMPSQSDADLEKKLQELIDLGFVRVSSVVS